MTDQAQTIAVRHSVVVDAPPERAFTVFTDEISRWWPGTHTLGGTPPVTEVVEPRVGGRLYDRDADGQECDWGRVLAWEPPDRFVFSWEVSAEWKHDPSVASTVEVLFRPEGSDRTRVELEHRGLEVYGEQAEQIRGIFGSDQGWSHLLGLFAGAARG